MGNLELVLGLTSLGSVEVPAENDRTRQAENSPIPLFLGGFLCVLYPLEFLTSSNFESQAFGPISRQGI